ncbi:MAG: hypothetical protein AAFS10_21465, partial [Myxococcota bacterium]
LGRVLNLAEEVKNPRQALESQAIRSFAHIIHGNIRQGLHDCTSCYQLAIRRDDAQVQFWSLIGHAFCLMRLGRPQDGIHLLEKSKGLMGDELTNADAILYHGVMALFQMRLGDPIQALDYAERALALITQKAPVAWWTHKGLIASAEAALLLMHHPGRDDLDPSVYQKLARNLTEGLLTFGRKFPMGRSASLLYMGMFQHMTGSQWKAIRSLKAAIDYAKKLDMPYEQGRAHIALAKLLKPADPRRYRHLHKGVQLLKPLGVLRIEQSTDSKWFEPEHCTVY